MCGWSLQNVLWRTARAFLRHKLFDKHSTGSGAMQSTGSYSDAFGGGNWGGYGLYLQEKDSRIDQQLRERHAGDGTAEGIFTGCIFWLDGRTRIPEYKLKALMMRHGGEYESYSLSRVTHVVADNLAMGNKKWQQIR